MTDSHLLNSKNAPAFRLDGIQTVCFWVYQLAWHFSLPLAFLYFWWRGRKEPLYRSFLSERFGRIQCSLPSPIWIHSASLGELRGAIPLINRLLSEGLPILITTLTPAGRNAATRHFAGAISQGVVQVSYLPLELPWAVKRFAKSAQARCMISTEIDTWPVLLHTLKKMRLPVALANAQYPEKSFLKDCKWPGFRLKFFSAYDLVLCKSKLHAQRFLRAHCPHVEVVGELRFELPIPDAHRDAAKLFLDQFPGDLRQRGVICLASVVEGEDDWVLDAFTHYAQLMQKKGKATPLLVYVPRSPQRFDAVAKMIEQRGLKMQRRSLLLDANLKCSDLSVARDMQVFLGDSLGEMYFYQALADIVTVCGSFNQGGSHNVIEPLALLKPVIVGPSVWGIEYPGQEALAARVLKKVTNAQELPEHWAAWFSQTDAREQAKQLAIEFMRAHAGSVERHWLQLSPWLKSHE